MGKVGGVVMPGPGVTVSVSGALLACALALSVTVTTTPVEVVAFADSVPETAPALTPRPVGRPVADQV